MPSPYPAPPVTETPNFKNFLLAISGVVLVWLPVLLMHLTLVLFSALVVYAVTRSMSWWLRVHVVNYLPTVRPLAKYAELVSLVLLAGLLGLGVYIFGDWISDKLNITVLHSLIEQVLAIFEQLHVILPPTITQHLPGSVSSFKAVSLDTLKHHAPQLQTVGMHTIRGIGYVVAGSLIGGIAALQVPSQSPADAKPLAVLLRNKFDALMNGFSSVFFAQVKISAINTILTSIYLLGILPAIGHPLPMAWTIVMITFGAGLIPVVGNLFSNVLIVMLSLTHGLGVSIASLVWLMAIHKLEYFLNAQIIGHKIRASAWELLLFMLILESIFGLSGVISAPIIYAQIKRIFMDKGWV